MNDSRPMSARASVLLPRSHVTKQENLTSLLAHCKKVTVLRDWPNFQAPEKGPAAETFTALNYGGLHTNNSIKLCGRRPNGTHKPWRKPRLKRRSFLIPWTSDPVSGKESSTSPASWLIVFAPASFTLWIRCMMIKICTNFLTPCCPWVQLVLVGVQGLILNFVALFHLQIDWSHSLQLIGGMHPRIIGNPTKFFWN